MNEKERQAYTIEEIEAIYFEFTACLDQLTILKPFFVDLIAVAKGEKSVNKLTELIKQEN